MTLPASSRNNAIDMVRLLAMSMVVCIHTVDGDELSLCRALYNISVVAVPLFFVCSGYLLLGRQSRPGTTRYAGAKVLSCLRIIITVSLATYALYLIRGFGIPLGQVIRNTITQEGTLMHIWFLWAMCIIYALYPAINKLYNTRPRIFDAVFAVVLATMTAAFAMNITRQFEPGIVQPLRIWNWLGYFMLGGYLRRHPLKIARPGIYTAVMAVVALISMHLIYPLIGTSFCEYFYSSPVTVIFTALIFTACGGSTLHSKYNFSNLSALFLPVYLIHPFVMAGIRSVLYPVYEPHPLLLFAIVYTITFALCAALTRIPPVKTMLSI